MGINKKWFMDRIAETPQGSLRRIAPLIRGPKGPLNASQFSRMLSGEQSIRLEEVREIAGALGVSPIDVLINVGVITEAEVRRWAKN